MNSHGNEINFRYYHCEVGYHTIPESEMGICVNPDKRSSFGIIR